ncbi:MAG TPA: ATP-binding protein [Fimbriiglobus sp.]|nr:ATP-binding protein [Fimbriiglobus sp.]
MPKLTVLSGSDAGREFDLAAPSVSVGRHSTNAVHLHDERVSRRHLELRANPAGGYQLFDLGSGNGTRVNGRPVQVIDLRPGDRIELGDTTLEYTGDVPAERTRLVVRPSGSVPSAILRTVAADAGSQILARPDLATDWVRTRLASLAVMYEASAAVSHILDVDELLGRIVDLALRTTDADHGCALLADPDTGDLAPTAARSRPGHTDAEFVVSRTVADHVLKEEQGVLVADAAADERFRGGESIARHRIREVICVPLRGRRETVGVLFLDTQALNRGGDEEKRRGFEPEGEKRRGGEEERGADSFSSSPPLLFSPSRFTEDHLNLAVALAHQAALAVEETRYYRALVQAEKLAAVGQTIAALSHHIKNIMQGVRFGGDMVRTAMADDDTELLQKGWRLVEKNQARIDDLILDMLSYSKDREPATEPTALNALVEDVLEVVRGRATGLRVALDWKPGELPEVPCDPEGIHKALLNVASNAVDAVEGKESPRVEFSTGLSADGRFAEIAVADNGPGIPADRLADVFKPFVSSKGSKGTGLGLPVSRKVLREHGGDVTVESSPGLGCRFVLQIPLERRATSDEE